MSTGTGTSRMQHLVPYCVYNHEHWILSIHTRDAREPIKTYKSDPLLDVVHDDVVEYAVTKMLSWADSLHRDSALHIDASGTTDAQLFADMLARLDDKSVHIEDIYLNCNTGLPLHKFVSKLADCHDVSLGLPPERDNEPIVSDNSGMLRLLSESLVSPTIGYVCLEVHEPLTLRRQQAATLLANASKFTYTMSHSRMLAYPHQLPLAELAAAKPASLHIDEVETQLETLIEFLATVQDNLASLQLEFECAQPVQDSTLKILLQSLRSMPQLRTLQLRSDCHNLWFRLGAQSECLVVRLLKFATRQSELALHTLHIVVNEKLLQNEHEVFGYAGIQQQLRTTAADLLPSCSVTIDVQPVHVRQASMPAGYSNTEYQSLFDEVQTAAGGLHRACPFPSARHAFS